MAIHFLFSLQEVFVRAKRDATKPDLIIVIINEKDNNVYSNVKHLGEVVCHIPTQVLLKRSVLKDEATLMHNVCLKINSKLGGTNQRISKSNLPAVLKRPVIIILNLILFDPVPSHPSRIRPESWGF